MRPALAVWHMDGELDGKRVEGDFVMTGVMPRRLWRGTKSVEITPASKWRNAWPGSSHSCNDDVRGVMVVSPFVHLREAFMGITSPHVVSFETLQCSAGMTVLVSRIVSFTRVTLLGSSLVTWHTDGTCETFRDIVVNVTGVEYDDSELVYKSAVPLF